MNVLVEKVPVLVATEIINKLDVGAQLITAPKTYAGDIKAFANKAASRKSFILLCKCVET